MRNATYRKADTRKLWSDPFFDEKVKSQRACVDLNNRSEALLPQSSQVAVEVEPLMGAMQGITHTSLVQMPIGVHKVKFAKHTLWQVRGKTEEKRKKKKSCKMNTHIWVIYDRLH